MAAEGGERREERIDGVDLRKRMKGIDVVDLRDITFCSLSLLEGTCDAPDTRVGALPSLGFGTNPFF